MSDIFSTRINLKPYEYPELLQYVDGVRHSYWVHTEFNFTADVGDFKTKLTKSEQEALKRTMLAISQIEVAVKNFWGDIHKRLPKPEVGAVGATFAESEVRHADAYAHLLEILGLNGEFEHIMDHEVFKKRYEYLTEVSRRSKDSSNIEFYKSIILFSLLIEHVSLFSQFLVMLSFNKYQNIFPGISNAVEATSKEEQLHGTFGIDLARIIRQENPDWFTEEVKQEIVKFVTDALAVEEELIDWIFEEGELGFMPKIVVKEFVRSRINKSCNAIDIDDVVATDNKLVEQTEWFDDEILTTKHVDFFYKRSINYNKKSKSITANDLF